MRDVAEANPTSFSDEFERLSLINVTCDKVGTVDSNASVVGLRDVSPDSLAGGIDVDLGLDSGSGNSSVLSINSDGFEKTQDVRVSDALNVSESDMEINPDVPTVAGRDVLKKEILADDSLRACRDLANKELNWYKWSDGVLIHSIIEKDNYPVDRIVLPTTRRCQALIST